MTRLIGKFWLLTAALCLLATTSPCGDFAGNHPLPEEANMEWVVNVEVTESVDRRAERHLKRTPATKAEWNSGLSAGGQRLACCRFFTPSAERDRLNGRGCYLLT